MLAEVKAYLCGRVNITCPIWAAATVKNPSYLVPAHFRLQLTSCSGYQFTQVKLWEHKFMQPEKIADVYFTSASCLSLQSSFNGWTSILVHKASRQQQEVCMTSFLMRLLTSLPEECLGKLPFCLQQRLVVVALLYLSLICSQATNNKQAIITWRMRRGISTVNSQAGITHLTAKICTMANEALTSHTKLTRETLLL